MASETTDDAELIERLRGPVFGTPTALDAAAAIETWKARAERLADMHRDMCVVAGEAISKAELAEAALQPFVKEAQRLGLSSLRPDDERLTVTVNAGDIRAALAAIAKADGKPADVGRPVPKHGSGP